MNRRIETLLTVLTLFLTFEARGGTPGLSLSPLVVVSNPPPVQMLVPGFTVRESPLQLNNINCFCYSPDGRLFALGYDGNVYQLSSTNGDGLIDSASYFYKNDHNEIPPSIGMAWGPGGLYIASQKRIIRLKDTDDGTSKLETVASNWVGQASIAGSGIDTDGVAVDPSGNIYFGLGCDSWINPYRVTTNGTSEYNFHSERGTILKISPDWQTREVVATGLRFTVSIAFNTNGDLFCTDQEGATWCPNGNPFDELLFIQQGRHYGFPPRHPKFLPNVIDEPSVFDYGPQHESTCGIHFDDPVAGGGRIFGPSWWRGDAIIAGESRGKIYRTKLVKTPDGYIAKNDLIACLNMLTIDAIPTIGGDLLVTCHGGAPDWGSGPHGSGKLFQISRADVDAPQPVLTYAASPTEFRVVFDQLIDPAQFKDHIKKAVITMGRYVTAGDRFESFTPGYQAVKDQQIVPRYALPVLSAAISADNRAIELQTLPHTTAVNYAIKLPEGLTSERACYKDRHELPQSAAIDVLADLTGVEANWQSAKKGVSNWSGWLPHLNLDVSHEFTAASAEHKRLFELLKRRGTLELRTQLDLWSMLHPAIQPGAKLDYEYPPEIVTVILKSHSALKVRSTAKIERVSDDEFQFTVTGVQNHWIPLDITLPTGGKKMDLEIAWFTDEDPRPRAFPLRRMMLPWASQETNAEFTVSARIIPEIAGGDWNNGKKLFFGDRVACYKCHEVNGQGGKIGPDLSGLVYRDYDSVYRDVTQPSAAINPDHIAYNIELKNGDTVTGVVMETTASQIIVGQVSGQNITIKKSDVAQMKASSISLMPEGLLNGLNANERRDLFTFLLGTKPEAK